MTSSFYVDVSCKNNYESFEVWMGSATDLSGGF